MSEPTECPNSFSVTINIDHIRVIKRANEILSQSDEQVATGVVVSYIESSYAGRSPSLWSWAYANPFKEKAVELTIRLTKGQARRLNEISRNMGISKPCLVRWFVSDTATQTGLIFDSV